MMPGPEMRGIRNGIKFWELSESGKKQFLEFLDEVEETLHDVPVTDSIGESGGSLVRTNDERGTPITQTATNQMVLRVSKEVAPHADRAG